MSTIWRQKIIVVDNDQNPKFSVGINKQSPEDLSVRKSLRKWKKHLRGSNEAAIPVFHNHLKAHKFVIKDHL